MNENDEPLEDDHGQDQSPAESVEEAPDASQAAEPTDAGTVVGRRNEDLPTENLTTPPTS